MMETPAYIEELRVVGGNLALDFLNTVNGDPPVECLRGYGDLVAWSVWVGLLSADEGERLVGEADLRPEDAEAAHSDALRLRGALSGVFRAIVEDEDPPLQNLEDIRDYECEALWHGRLARGDDGFDWEWTEEGDLARVWWPVAHAATELLTSGDLDRLKLCAGCYWLFLDASKNRSRRWCTMEVCGTDEKIRRYVAKRAAKRNAKRDQEGSNLS